MRETGNFQSFGGENRISYPDGFFRVTAGLGGESILFTLGNKVFLYDCGMAYCNELLIENIKGVLTSLGKSHIDYILLSHSHYDHIGALPYILHEYKDTIVCGALKCREVFERKGALETIISLGKEAARINGSSSIINNTDYRIDRILHDGEEITVGQEKIIAIECKGHTDCSMSYFILPKQFLFSCESTGVLVSRNFISTSILKDYNQSIKSAKKLKELRAQNIYSPHYGMVPKEMVDSYFDIYIDEARSVRKFILDLKNSGVSNEKILEKYMERYYDRAYEKDHPRAAFELNGKYIIKNME